jgi:hypothetical protein
VGGAPRPANGNYNGSSHRQTSSNSNGNTNSNGRKGSGISLAQSHKKEVLKQKLQLQEVKCAQQTKQGISWSTVAALGQPQQAHKNSTASAASALRGTDSNQVAAENGAGAAGDAATPNAADCTVIPEGLVPGPNFLQDPLYVRQEVPDIWQEVTDNQRLTPLFPSLTAMIWNANKLLSAGRELTLVNLLEATGTDIVTKMDCELPHTTDEFSVAGLTTFLPFVLAGGKTRVIVLVKNNLAMKANVRLCADLMDPRIQTVWLCFDVHLIRSSGRAASLGAFTIRGVYRT